MSTQIYDSRFVEIARTLTARGAIDRDLARAFGVHVQTIRDWKHAHPDFAAATKLSREQMLRATEASLFRRATGYSFESERVFCSPKDGTITRVACVEHVPPCDRAMRFWLETRRPETWAASAGQEPGESLEQLLTEFTRSRAFLASRWTTGPAWPWQGQPDPSIAEAQAEVGQASGSEDEGEETGTDPLADPRLWPAEADLTVQYPPSAHPEEPLSSAKWRLEGPPVSVLRDGSSPGSAPPQDERVGCADQLKSGAKPDEIIVPLAAAPGTSAYHNSFAARARTLAAHGALDRDLASAFEVHPATIQRWKLSHPAFAHAVTLGKDVADDAVEQALFSKANGYSYSSERIFCHEGKVVRTAVEVHLPPSANAARFLLEALGRKRWREAPDPGALRRQHEALRRERVRQADLAAAQAFERGLRGRDLQLHVLELFGVAPE